MERQTKFILTNEDWYPTKDGRVQVFFSQLRVPTDHPVQYRVSVWGADDHGLERDFPTRDEAKRMFDRIVDLTTHDQLYSWGFYHA